MSRKLIACDYCGFMITEREYAKNGGICFECKDEEDGYPQEMSHQHTEDLEDDC